MAPITNPRALKNTRRKKKKKKRKRKKSYFFISGDPQTLAMSTRLCLLYWLIWFLCFRFDALTELGAFMRTKFLCISVLRVAWGPRVKLASCKSALNPPVVYSTDRSKAMVPVLVLLFVALWFILLGDLLYVLPCVI